MKKSSTTYWLLFLITFACLNCSKEHPASDNEKDFNGCLGYAAGYKNSGTVGSPGTFTFKEAQNNKFLAQEVSIQRNFWNQVPATVSLLFEPSDAYRNAYALANGNIYFGYYLFYYMVNRFSVISPNEVSPLPVDGVLAHEWGHEVQFRLGWANYANNTERELEADFFSGYYMGLEKQWYWKQIQTYYTAIYSSGDYAFSSPNHHGTPGQRLNAAYTGLTTAVYEINNNVHYSYNQLHDIFRKNLEYIYKHTYNTTSLARDDNGGFKEVRYSRPVTRELIDRLKPTL
ncbi:hypothetical protein A8C56_22690 [Niabella ginsenosidivorans]|uniref:Metalloprotease n=1 Tax=Niabella ginsenosidivorans TaxID=1176587 RepID=A0A1A9I723_9BACT|nr:hypothetical protein [Niabella ginsenosidivorans]ANH83416.1 hypothetical protein A8C56_22690 [Niabella ginsenosidivorans]